MLSPSENNKLYILKGAAEDGEAGVVPTQFNPYKKEGELKVPVHVFLNVAHQQGCKVVTLGICQNKCFFLQTCLQSLFIHFAAAKLTDTL